MIKQYLIGNRHIFREIRNGFSIGETNKVIVKCGIIIQLLLICLTFACII